MWWQCYAVSYVHLVKECGSGLAVLHVAVERMGSAGNTVVLRLRVKLPDGL
jgi:hypothetical protein